MTMGILPYLEESRQQKHQRAVTSVQSPVCSHQCAVTPTAAA
ncbi:hypothetical protein ACST1Q_RS21870 [Escherichia coli]|nr:hypothetical protein [Escherichia coli]